MSTIARPFGMLLMFLYDLVNNYGLALILFAIVIRVILLPFQMKSKRGTMRQSRLQPKIAELQKKHGTNKQKINEEMSKLYKEEGVNPASGCLWGFLPLPIMFALFLVIREPLTMMMGVAADLLAAEPLGAILEKLNTLGFVSTVQPYYVQIDQAQFISQNFDKFSYLSDNLRHIDFNFGLLNLGMQPRWNFLWTTDWSNSAVWLPGLIVFFIPFLSAGSQFAATAINKKMNPVGTPEGQGGSMQTFMMLMPLMSVYFAFITPAALGFYWTIGTVLQIIQDVVLTKRYTKILDAEEAVKNEERIRKEAEIEAKRIETERKKAEGSVERNPNTSKRRKSKSDKQEQLERTAEWEKKNAPPDGEERYEPSRIGNRRYARGRAYDPGRYSELLEDGEGKEPPADDDEGYGSLGLPEAPEPDDGEYDGDNGADGSFDGEPEDGDPDPDDLYDDDDDDESEDDIDEEDDDSGDGGKDDVIPTVRFDTTRFDSDEENKD